MIARKMDWAGRAYWCKRCGKTTTFYAPTLAEAMDRATKRGWVQHMGSEICPVCAREERDDTEG